MQLVFLGRDGVINELANGPVLTPEAWRPLPGSLRAIARLTHAHYRVVVTSNQPALASGGLDVGTLNRIHEKMHREVAAEGGRIEAIIYCPHGSSDSCGCRKPAPGMLREICQRLHLVDPRGIPVIGDSQADMGAAQAIGARAMLVRTGRGRVAEARMEGDEMVEIHDDLAAAVDVLLAS